MASLRSRTFVDLAPRESLVLTDIQGVSLHVNRGTVWITQENDTQDIVLRPGDTWQVERPGRTIIEAQGHAVLWAVGRGIERAADRAVRSSLGGTFLARVRKGLAAWWSLDARHPVPYV